MKPHAPARTRALDPRTVLALSCLFALDLAPDAGAQDSTSAAPTVRTAATTDSTLLASVVVPSSTISAVPWMRATLRLAGADSMTKLRAPRTDTPPNVDGVLDDAVWERAALLEAFTHNRPVEGVKDTLGTVTLVLYDDKNLYIAFHAGDDPRKVQAPIVPRDQVWQGDWVGVSIDTYNDKQRSFFLCSNPAGIQMDGVDQEGRDSDMAPDFQYTSKGRVTDDGYDVEMAIPFTTLRFQPGQDVTFGFQAIRDIRRDGIHMYWSPVSRNINSYHTQIGSMSGLQGVRPGRNIQITPTYTTTTAAESSPSGMDYGDPEGRAGLDAKVGLTSNLIADLTVTPDFSQIEADAGVVDINERFAIFYPEKRPFFLEGSDIFTMPINLMYTRQIVDPLYGGKLSGKLRRMSFGVLSSADRSSGESIDGLPDPANPYSDQNAVFNIGRLRRDVFKSSYVGVFGADRTLDDEYNRVAAADGRLSWADKFSLTFQGAHSWDRAQDFSSVPPGSLPPDLGGLTGQETQGDAYYASVARDSRPLNTGFEVRGTSPDFQADMGFIQRTDIRAYAAWFNPHLWAKENQWYTGIHFPNYYEVDYSWDNQTKTDEVVSLVQEIVFPRNRGIGMENVYRFIRHNGVEFDNIFRRAMWAWSEAGRTLRGGATYVWGDQVVFAETVPGHDRRWELWSDFRFSTQFDGGLSVNAATVWRQDDTKFREALIPRLRLSYQFTRELSLRWITELQARRSYDTSGNLTEKSQSLVPDILLSYYVRPGTVIYLGYGATYDGEETEDLAPQSASVFTKFSYLWQL